MEEDWLDSGVLKCTTGGMGVAETLTQSAPMARKVKTALENMMMERVSQERTDNNGTRPEVREGGEGNWGELHSG